MRQNEQDGLVTYDRFPPLPAHELTESQRTSAAEIIGGERGELIGPFIPLLRSPELMRRLAQTGEYLRFQSTLSRSVFEMTVLVVAKYWNQTFEWNYHCPLALQAGLSKDIIESIATGNEPRDLDAKHQGAFTVISELLETHQLGNDTFAAATEALGETNLIDLIGTVGYYSSLAMVLNAARTPSPDASRTC